MVAILLLLDNLCPYGVHHHVDPSNILREVILVDKLYLSSKFRPVWWCFLFSRHDWMHDFLGIKTSEAPI